MKYTITEHLIGILVCFGILFILYWIMFFFHKFVCFIKKETWWRKYYKRVQISEFVSKCDVCVAGTIPIKSMRCDIMKGRYCPCKSNQCLQLK